MQVYMMDLVDGGTTLIADEPSPGLIRSSDPRWSNDGRRIVFAAAMDRHWRRSRLMSIDVREGDGNLTLKDLGARRLPDLLFGRQEDRVLTRSEHFGGRTGRRMAHGSRRLGTTSRG